ncbi:MAG: hypothetical protein KME23_08115 [Goleter apudmare HA4340-LM2]|jgi:hypothetical protein|nr:hypothetical protein [Goleter apudmare HA4340-LM2]
MFDPTEINTTTTEPEDSSEGGLTGRWESEDNADGTVFDEETQTETSVKANN